MFLYMLLVFINSTQTLYTCTVCSVEPEPSLLFRRETRTKAPPTVQETNLHREDLVKRMQLMML